MTTRTLICICALLMPTAFSAGAASNDSLGLPGDNLDLAAVLDLFKKSESPEAFEKALNAPDNKVNNLDLNGDQQTDYLRVIDQSETDAHALVLQDVVSEKETQDVAVIELEKNGENSAKIQVTGDSALYGKNYIVEPQEEAATYGSAQPAGKTTVVVNVYTWPAVHYIYRPSYAPWVSPWRWMYYPPWWKPWKPLPFYVYHPFWHHHHMLYPRIYEPRMIHARQVYYSHRAVARPVVAPRRSTQVQRNTRQERRVSKPRNPQPARGAQRGHTGGGGRRR